MTDPTPAAGPEAVPHEVVHLAAQWFRVNTRLRQRCGWCGAMLVDVDMTIEHAATVDPDDATGGYPTWPTGGLVAHDGNVWWVVEDLDDDEVLPLPAGACAKLPPEATA